MTPVNPAGMAQNEASEPFPALEDPPSPKSPPTDNQHTTRSRDHSSTSTFQERLRSASKTFTESAPPTGFCIATGQIASSIPSVTDIRRGSYSSEGWSGEGQIREKERRATLSRRGSAQTGDEVPRRKSSAQPNSPRETISNQDAIPETVPEVSGESEKTGLGIITSGDPLATSEATNSMSNPVPTEKRVEQPKGDQRSSSDTNITPSQTGKTTTVTEFRTEPFDNGYQFPPKHKWTESTATGLRAFWGFFITPVGFLVTIYGLNVVAWGGMLFLLLCNASPAMCHPSCGDINSPRRKWIEVDSQILNALFCVTGFGLIPWRFRDLYYLLQYRVMKNELGLRRLAGINRGWFRLAGSQNLSIEFGPAEVEAGAIVPENCIPFPAEKIPNAPLTGTRAPPTKMWKLDFVIWAMVWNTFLQAVLSGFMWGFNRYNRPSWSTGLFVALACIVAACGGIMAFVEGKHVKAIEGVPVSEKDQERLKHDRELGITHYNNIKDEGPKEKKEKAHDKGLFKRKQNAEAVAVNESALEEAAAQTGR
jgi:hypothetical protein